MLIDGKKVADAKKPLHITITNGDIKKGNLKASDSCAAAIACVRQLKATEAIVHLSRVYINMSGRWSRFRTPFALRSEIIAFDRGGKFEPGSYTLSPLQPSVRLGAPKKEARGETGTHPQRGRRKRVHKVAGVRSAAFGGRMRSK